PTRICEFRRPRSRPCWSGMWRGIAWGRGLSRAWKPGQASQTEAEETLQGAQRPPAVTDLLVEADLAVGPLDVVVGPDLLADRALQEHHHVVKLLCCQQPQRLLQFRYLLILSLAL